MNRIIKIIGYTGLDLITSEILERTYNWIVEIDQEKIILLRYDGADTLISLFLDALKEEIIFRLPLIFIIKYIFPHQYKYLILIFVSMIFSSMHLMNVSLIKKAMAKHNIHIHLSKLIFGMILTTFYGGLILGKLAIDSNSILDSTLVHFLYNFSTSYVERYLNRVCKKI